MKKEIISRIKSQVANENNYRLMNTSEYNRVFIFSGLLVDQLSDSDTLTFDQKKKLLINYLEDKDINYIDLDLLKKH